MGRKKGDQKRNRLVKQTAHYYPNPSAGILPPEIDVMLEFIDVFYLSPGALFVNKRMRPNCAYDVDPVLGSTSTAGFAELASIYQFYRVVKYDYEVQFDNNSTQPSLCGILNSNTDPGTGAAISAYAGNPFCDFRILGRQGGYMSQQLFKGSYRVATIVGSDTPETDDNFSSLTNTVPTNSVWLTAWLDASVVGGSNVSQTSILFKIKMHTRFYERKLQSS
jgi:hypothetical protein